MTEDDLQRTVIAMCKRLGLLVAHFKPAMTAKGRWVTPVGGDGKGFPDCVIVGPAGVLYRELKQEGKYPSAEQRIWLSRLTAAGADAGVWRPRHLNDGTIEAALKRIAKPVEVTS